MTFDELFARELRVVELDGTEKTWISGVYNPPTWRGDEGSYLFTRSITAAEAGDKEVKTVTLKETNGSYPCRYWTNLPIFWDTHAVVVEEAPDTLWQYEYCWEVFEYEGILDDWLGEDAFGYWNDGSERSHEEFEDLCDEYVENRKEECSEIPFDEWMKEPVLTREEWLEK